jgi:hypothetical protein
MASTRATNGEQTPDRIFLKRQSEACPLVSSVITTLAGKTVTLPEPTTIYIIVTAIMAEPTLSDRGVAVSLSPRSAIPCSDCIQAMTEVTLHEAPSPGHQVLEARVPFPLIGNSTACNATITTTVTLPGSTVTIRPIVTLTEIVTMPPKLLTPADSLDRTSRGVVDTPSSEIPQMSTARSDPSTSTSTWLKEKPPPERIVSAPNDVPPVVTTAQATRPDGTPNSQPMSSVPSISIVDSLKPASGQAESGMQVQTTQLPAVEGQQPPSSVFSIPTTYIPAEQHTEAAIPASPPVITLGTNIYSPVFSSSVYIINSQTLAPGGPAITVSNSILSLATSGTQLVVAPTGIVNDGQPANPATTIQLFPNPSSLPSSVPNPVVAPAPAPAPVIATIGNSPITLDPKASSIVFTPSTGGYPMTILPGSAALTLPGGTIISLAPSTPTSNSLSAAPAPAVLIISTIGAPSAQSITFPNSLPLSLPAPAPPPTQSYIPIHISGNPPSIIVGDGNGASANITLTPGAPAVTLDGGIPISLGTDTSILVLGSSTITIAATATGIGGYLHSGLRVGHGDGTSTLGLGLGSGVSMTTSLTSTLVKNEDSRLNTAGIAPSSSASRSENGASNVARTSSTDPTLRTVPTSSIPASSSIAPPSTPAEQSNAALRGLAPWVWTLSCLSSLVAALFVLT